MVSGSPESRFAFVATRRIRPKPLHCLYYVQLLTCGIPIVHNIVQKIGYPQESPDIYNSTELRNYYGAVDISDLAYFNNALSMTKFDIAQMWAKLGRPTDRNEWGMTVPTVNVSYC